MRRLRNFTALAAIMAVLAFALPAPVAAQDQTLFGVPLPGAPAGGHVHGVRMHTDGTYVNMSVRNFFKFGEGVAFSELSNLAQEGVIVYCRDCTRANPCAGSGDGALAKRLAGVWICN